MQPCNTTSFRKPCRVYPGRRSLHAGRCPDQTGPSPSPLTPHPHPSNLGTRTAPNPRQRLMRSSDIRMAGKGIVKEKVRASKAAQVCGFSACLCWEQQQWRTSVTRPLRRVELGGLGTMASQSNASHAWAYRRASLCFSLRGKHLRQGNCQPLSRAAALHPKLGFGGRPRVPAPPSTWS
eukprot:gene23494-biopygen16362